MDEDSASRFFWWNADSLTRPWQPLYVGGTDEWCNRTLGIRLPGGVLFLVLNPRLRNAPCAQCAQPGQ